ncbi:MAG: hypothetical protein ACK55I_09535, partial [bacterium]
LHAHGVVHTGHGAEASADAIAVAHGRRVLLVDRLVAIAEITLPLPTRHPARGRTLPERAGEIVGAPINGFLLLGARQSKRLGLLGRLLELLRAGLLRRFKLGEPRL